MSTTTTTYRCLFCGESVVDGRAESGYTGEGPDWMTVDGDFGCDQSPETMPCGLEGEEEEDGGCGSHAVTEAEARRAEGSDEAAHVSEVLERRRESRKRLRDAAPALLRELEELVYRCDAEEGVQPDGSNMDTRGAHAAISQAKGEA